MDQTTLFKWPINHFHTFASRENSNLILNSDDFKLESGKETFLLSFYPTADQKDNTGDCAIYLMPKNLKNQKFRLSFKFWVENNCGILVVDKSKRLVYQFVDSKFGYGLSSFIHHKRLYGNKLIKNDFVFICCEIRRLPLVEEPEEKSNDASSELQLLRKNMHLLYKQGIVDKVTILIGEDHRFEIAKNILMTESEVFYNMLTIDMAESKQNSIKIEGFRPEIMSAFLDFLHLQHLDDFDPIAQELFEIADKYEVKKLVNLCVESMEKTFDGSNSLKRLELAFMHGNDKLKQIALDYVTSRSNIGNFRHIMKTKEWKKLRQVNDTLAQEIMDAIFDETHWLS